MSKVSQQGYGVSEETWVSYARILETQALHDYLRYKNLQSLIPKKFKNMQPNPVSKRLFDIHEDFFVLFFYSHLRLFSKFQSVKSDIIKTFLYQYHSIASFTPAIQHRGLLTSFIFVLCLNFQIIFTEKIFNRKRVVQPDMYIRSHLRTFILY